MDANPQYLTINNKDHLKAITMSVAKGLENMASVTTPLENLRARLTRDELIKAQKEEFKYIRKRCIESECSTTAENKGK